MPIRPAEFSIGDAFARVRKELDVLGLSIVSIAIGIIGLFRADPDETRLAILGAGILAIAALLSAGRKILQLEDMLKPRFDVLAPTELSEIRDQARHDPRNNTTMLVDFIGLEIRNTRPEPIRNVQVDLLSIQKPRVYPWRGKLALNWAPRDEHERANEPINTLSALKHEIPAMVCLCSISGSGEIWFGTFSRNWADNLPFETHLKDNGEYIFEVRVSAEDGSATKTVFCALNWTGKKQDAKIRIVPPPTEHLGK